MSKISYFLHNECGIKCFSSESIECLQDIDIKNNYEKNLLLINITGKNINKLLFELEDNYKKLTTSFNIALFNMKYNTGIENE